MMRWLTHGVYGVLPVYNPRQHVHEGHAKQGHHHDLGGGYCAVSLSCRSMAHTNISLKSQCQGEPVRCCVEYLGSCLQGKLK